jgi:hypothetical protein
MEGTKNVGGLLGILNNSFPSQQQVSLIENSYSNGLVVGTSFTGGLIGQILYKLLRLSIATGIQKPQVKCRVRVELEKRLLNFNK